MPCCAPGRPAMPVGVACPTTPTSRRSRPSCRACALVALHFPKWVDGRAYSQAHLLRARYRFAGEIRATGDVLVDMLPLLQRTGFDAVQLRADQSAEAARRALAFFPGHYQGDVAERGRSSRAEADPVSAVDLHARAERRVRGPAGANHRPAAGRGRCAHAGRIVQATSLGAEDMVITDLIARHRAAGRHRHARDRHAARRDAGADPGDRAALRRDGRGLPAASTRR